MAEVTKALIYCRVSSKKQKQGDGLESGTPPPDLTKNESLLLRKKRRIRSNRSEVVTILICSWHHKLATF